MNYFYFAFVTPVVQEFERINALLQQTVIHMILQKNCLYTVTASMEDFAQG